MKSLKFITTLFLSLMLSVYAQAKQVEKEISIVGSTTVLPITQVTAEKFMELNPNVYISVGGGGSSVGAKSLIAGTCDIADCSRALKEKEIKKAMSKGIEPKPYVVAIDGIVMIVNRSNSLQNISLNKIKLIYTGDISDWSNVNGKKGKIIVVSRDTSSGTFEAFEKLVLNKARVRADALLQASNKAVLTTVANTPGAIGYIGMGYLDNSVNALSVNGIVATKDTVLSGKYPIARPLYMYTDGEAQGVIKDYLDFIFSVQGQELVEEQGFVGIKK